MSETQTQQSNTENQANQQQQQNSQQVQQPQTKFCKHCGEKIDVNAVICPKCGCQVEQLQNQQNAAQPNIVINNSNMNSNVNNNGYGGRPKNKWVALVLLIFLGIVGGHKFYEGKAGMGILYLFTGGLFGIGLIVDFITLLLKPNPYYV